MRLPPLTWIWIALAALADPVSGIAAAGVQDEGASKYGFLVGVQDYDPDPRVNNGLRPLSYTRGDVIDLAETLRSRGVPGEHIVLMHDQQANRRFLPTRKAILEEIEALASILRPQDALIVAFSGHGLQYPNDHEEGYFCPIDANPKDRASLIKMSAIKAILRQCAAGTKLLLIDACRDLELDANGARGPNIANVRALVANPVRAVPDDPLIIFSCSAGQQAFEHPKLRHGIFFHHVIEGLKGAADEDDDRFIALDEIEAYLKQEVPRTSYELKGVVQKPFTSGNNANPKRALLALDTRDAWIKPCLDDFQAGRFPEVIKRCNRLIAHDPSLKRAYHLRARARLAVARRLEPEGEEFAAIVHDLDDALRNNREPGPVYLDRAGLMLRVGQPSRAVEDFDRAVAAGVKSADLYFDRAMARSKLGKPEDAIADLTSALELDPRHLDALINRGAIRTELRALEPALRDLQAALEIDPERPTLRLSIGAIHLQQQQFDPAIKELIEGLRLLGRHGEDAERVRALYNLGLAYCLRAEAGAAAGPADRAKRDFERATLQLEEALRIEPRDVLALTCLGRVHLLQDRNGEALRCLEDAVTSDPRGTCPLARVYLGNVRYNRRDDAAAIAAFDDALKLDPTLADAYRGRGFAHRRRGEADEAAADFERYQRLTGKPPVPAG